MAGAKNKNSKKKKDETALVELRKRIQFVFDTAGFEYVATEGHEMNIGLRAIELDKVFVYKNIILICEDTDSNSEIEHALTKQEAFQQIEQNKQAFLARMKQEFPQQHILFEDYLPNEYRIVYLYFTVKELSFNDDEDTKKRFNLIKFVHPRSLEYLYQMAGCIQKSVRYEIFRFLEITDDEIGDPSSTAGKRNQVNATIISPPGSTGLKNGVRVVSFMMSAEVLIKNAYVLRKDNWQESVFLYQRLIQRDRINSIRDYILKNEAAFYNNIIVSLPDDIQFLDDSGHQVDLNTIQDHKPYTMLIPDKMNSICVIDGQHRIYAHYESVVQDKNEEKMQRMRKRLHLLVTGIIYPSTMKKNERIRYESQIFLDINSNAKPVPPEVLIHIETMANPLGSSGLARTVLVKMNNDSNKPLSNMLEISSLEKGKIKISSIIKFALSNLVDINSKRRLFFYYWNGDKEKLKSGNEEALDDYIKFCVRNLNQYFSAIKNVFADDWNDSDSKLKSVISINGFIIAYGYCMENLGIKDVQFFIEKFSELQSSAGKIDFSRKNFPYTSSQYKKFSRERLEPLFVAPMNNTETEI